MLPPIDSGPSGANFFDLYAGMLYVHVQGRGMIDITMTSVVILDFGFPTVPIEDFFTINVRENLAKFLRCKPQNTLKFNSHYCYHTTMEIVN